MALVEILEATLAGAEAIYVDTEWARDVVRQVLTDQRDLTIEAAYIGNELMVNVTVKRFGRWRPVISVRYPKWDGQGEFSAWVQMAADKIASACASWQGREAELGH